MAAFLPIAVLLSLLVTGAMAGGYGSQTPSPSTPAPYTPTPATPPPTPTPAPYTPQPATPKPAPAAHGYDDKKLLVVRVEGLVVCQSCAKRGSQSLDGAAPLPGANVTVTCRDRKNRVMAYRRRVADSNGYFHAEFSVQRADGYLDKDPCGACFVRLLSSPDPKCNIVTNIHGGLEGAPLRDEGKQWTDGRGFKNVVFAAGPLAFRPRECAPTHHY
ncbi:non-classical arabinogalactan protein 30-like [Miscanthus floridulus]|uniref:non-classical arabinogalactan protein 30-like n=1 Tax=Miscanthus floridulus TaxID=154761 RepID=UPI0034574BC5